MAHFIFQWPDEMEDKEIEKMATAISGAFLFPETVPDFSDCGSAAPWTVPLSPGSCHPWR